MQALDGADEVFVLDVYAAREQPMAGVSGASVAEHVSVPVTYLPDFSAVAERVAEVLRPGDVVSHHGRRRRHHARRGDPCRPADQGQSQRARRAGNGAEMTEPQDPTDGASEPDDDAEPKEATLPPRRHPTTRAHGARRVGNVRSGVPPRPAPPPSKRPAATPSGAPPENSQTIRKSLGAARFGA